MRVQVARALQGHRLRKGGGTSEPGAPPGVLGILSEHPTSSLEVACRALRQRCRHWVLAAVLRGSSPVRVTAAQTHALRARTMWLSADRVTFWSPTPPHPLLLSKWGLRGGFCLCFSIIFCCNFSRLTQGAWELDWVGERGREHAQGQREVASPPPSFTKVK